MIIDVHRSNTEMDMQARISELERENNHLRGVLREALGYMEETDPYPTSDEHPVYKMRAALKGEE